MSKGAIANPGRHRQDSPLLLAFGGDNGSGILLVRDLVPIEFQIHCLPRKPIAEGYPDGGVRGSLWPPWTSGHKLTKFFAKLSHAAAGPANAPGAGSAGIGLLALALPALLSRQRVAQTARTIGQRWRGGAASADAAFLRRRARARALDAGRARPRIDRGKRRRNRSRLHVTPDAGAVPADAGARLSLGRNGGTGCQECDSEEVKAHGAPLATG